MRRLVLILNAGSSSLKASVMEEKLRVVACHAEALGTPESFLRIDYDQGRRVDIKQANLSHQQVFKYIVDNLNKLSLLEHIVATGHRVVHGGTFFPTAVVIDDEVLKRLDSIQTLAPLHNPVNVAGIRLMMEILPRIPSIAVFDTSFHSTIPEKAYTYPLPSSYRDLNMRKFGFHGTSVQYVSHLATAILKENHGDKDFNMVVCHLGSGASVTAVVGEKSMDTSMGFTPLAGLMMGTRCGSVDPALVGFACTELQKTVHEVISDFNTNSGLKGMVNKGDSYDMRDLLRRESEDPKAALAVDMFIYRLAQYIAASMVALEGPLDALVFTAGIGEHGAAVRKRAVDQLKPILRNVELDHDRNRCDGALSGGILSREGAWPMILSIPTDEEVMIAIECLRLVGQTTIERYS